MSHPFETLEKPYFKRLKTDALLDGMNTKCSKVCQAVLKPAITPRAPHPRGKEIKPFVMPAHSRWFKFGEIHQIERMQFPEIDEDPNFEKEYIKIRDDMVKLYRLYPTTELKVTTVRHIHGGDATLIQRIHAFLSVWGLINFLSYPYSEQEMSKEATILRDEYAQLFDAKIITPPNGTLQRNTITCTLCRSECGEGHFLSIKYPGIILCTRCFTNTQAFNQIGAHHAAFEFKTLYQPYPINKAIHTENQKQLVESLEREKKCGEKYEMDRKNTFPYDKYAVDWQQVALDTNKQNGNPTQTPVYSQLDCFLTSVRIREGDYTAPKTLFNHEFNEVSRMEDLIGFVENGEEQHFEEVQMPPHVDWESLDNDIDEITNLIQNSCDTN